MQFFCQACLKTGDNVAVMSSTEETVYRNLICKIPDSSDLMYICAYCRCILQKLTKFIKQCERAFNILNDVVVQDTKLLPSSPIIHLSSSSPAVFYVGPDEEPLTSNVKSEEGCEPDDEVPPVVGDGRPNGWKDGSEDAVHHGSPAPTPLGMFIGDDDHITDDVKSELGCESDDEVPPVVVDGRPDGWKDGLEDTRGHGSPAATPQVLYIGDDDITGDVKSELDGDGLRSGDEDDLPLVMLGRSDALESEGKNPTEDISPKQVNGSTKKAVQRSKKRRVKEYKKRKQKKQLKEGFTSRMVQETDEYVVIKLSKEQVLKEMAENSTAAKYLMYPYKCEKCVKGFNFEDVLTAHLEKHSPKNGELQCDICSQYCASSVSLRGHMKSHTTRYKCKVCGLVRLSRQHVLEHHGIAHTAAAAAYTCDRCRFTTHKRTVIQHHVRTHTPREPHACHRCGKLYKNLETLRIHITRHDEKKRHQCEHCNFTFVYASQLHKHVRSVHERRDYYCVECDVVFKSMDTMRLHFQKAKRHRDATSYKYKCGQCSQRFVSQSTLATHETSTHGAEKRSVCTLCADRRAYSSRAALRVHVRRTHAARESVPCPICDRLFARKSCLTVHMRTHTGETPHACECGAAFARASALKAHTLAEHKNSIGENVTEQ